MMLFITAVCWVDEGVKSFRGPLDSYILAININEPNINIGKLQVFFNVFFLLCLVLHFDSLVDITLHLNSLCIKSQGREHLLLLWSYSMQWRRFAITFESVLNAISPLETRCNLSTCPRFCKNKEWFFFKLGNICWNLQKNLCENFARPLQHLHNGITHLSLFFNKCLVRK